MMVQLGNLYYYFRILALHPWLVFYWPLVALTGRDRREVSGCRCLTSYVDGGDEGSQQSQGLSSRCRRVAASHQGQTTHSRQTYK